LLFQNTALHNAAMNGHVKAVKLFLDLNASFLRNNRGSTCFTEAIINRNKEVALAIVQVLRHVMESKCCGNEDWSVQPDVVNQCVIYHSSA